MCLVLSFCLVPLLEALDKRAAANIEHLLRAYTPVRAFCARLAASVGLLRQSIK